MKNTNEAIIKVENLVQKVLLTNELIGQFSDGFWENSRNTSWNHMGEVEVVEESEETGVVFKEYVPRNYKGYSVNNKTLLEYVGDRMLVNAKLANSGIELPRELSRWIERRRL
jgi:hypothetical protein